MGVWTPMPTFTDGMNVDQDDLRPLVLNLEELRQSERVARGAIVQTAGILGTTSGTTELNITQLALPAISVTSGRFYIFGLQVYTNCSAAGNSFFFRVRQNTPLTGGVIVSVPLVSIVAGLDDTKTVALPWKATSTGNMSFHVSVQRLAGAGTASVYGDSKSAHWVEQMGDDGSVWALT